MWKKAVGAVALGIAGGAVAAPVEMTQADYAMCEKVAASSRAVMSARQHNVPLVDLMGLGGLVDDDYAGEWQMMLQLAYDEPVAATSEGRANTPVMFAQAVRNACRKNVEKAHQGK